MSVTTVTNALMIGPTPSLRDIISHGVWLSSRFTLSYRDVEEILFERGITVSHEAIRKWWRAWRSWGSRRLCQFLDLHIRVPTLEHLSQFAVKGFHAGL
jgi:hypothetical protein